MRYHLSQAVKLVRTSPRTNLFPSLDIGRSGGSSTLSISSFEALPSLDELFVKVLLAGSPVEHGYKLEGSLDKILKALWYRRGSLMTEIKYSGVLPLGSQGRLHGEGGSLLTHIRPGRPSSANSNGN
jgi:hypothetical protein